MSATTHGQFVSRWKACFPTRHSLCWWMSGVLGKCCWTFPRRLSGLAVFVFCLWIFSHCSSSQEECWTNNMEVIQFLKFIRVEDIWPIRSSPEHSAHGSVHILKQLWSPHSYLWTGCDKNEWMLLPGAIQKTARKNARPCPGACSWDRALCDFSPSPRSEWPWKVNIWTDSGHRLKTLRKEDSRATAGSGEDDGGVCSKEEDSGSVASTIINVSNANTIFWSYRVSLSSFLPVLFHGTGALC